MSLRSLYRQSIRQFSIADFLWLISYSYTTKLSALRAESAIQKVVRRDFEESLTEKRSYRKNNREIYEAKLERT